jgi:acyl carrier protein
MEAKIKKLMAEIFEVKEDQIADDMEAKEAPWWDSIKHLSLITALEEDFEITVTMKEIQSMTSFNRIKDIVSQHR